MSDEDVVARALASGARKLRLRLTSEPAARGLDMADLSAARDAPWLSVDQAVPCRGAVLAVKWGRPHRWFVGHVSWTSRVHGVLVCADYGPRFGERIEFQIRDAAAKPGGVFFHGKDPVVVVTPEIEVQWRQQETAEAEAQSARAAAVDARRVEERRAAGARRDEAIHELVEAWEEKIEELLQEARATGDPVLLESRMRLVGYWQFAVARLLDETKESA